MVLLAAGLIAVVALATLPVFEEIETPLSAVPVVGMAFEPYSIFSIPVPVRAPEHAHYRVRVAASKIWLDGSALMPNADGDFDLLNLNPRRPGRVAVVGWIGGEATLVETPRVFVSHFEIHPGGAKLDVRNTLDNTVNVYATVSNSQGAAMEAAATVPPGSTQRLGLSGSAGTGAPPWRITLEKQAEAMEGTYQFVKVTSLRTSQPVNSYVKP